MIGCYVVYKYQDLLNYAMEKQIKKKQDYGGKEGRKLTQLSIWA